MAGIDSNTILMLHLNGNTNDSSFHNFSISSNNITFANTSPEFIGTEYVVFQTNPNGGTITAPNAVLGFLPSDFTVEAWIYPTDFSQAGNILKASSGGTPPANSYEIIFTTDTSGRPQIIVYNAPDYEINFTGTTLTLNTWQHIAFVKYGNIYSIYVNGTLTGTMTSSYVITPPTSQITIGYEYGLGNALTGYMCEHRVSNIARWTTNFTPPTSPYSSGSGNTGMFTLVSR